MNEQTHFISLILYSRKGWRFCGVWEMGGETYTQREDIFFPYLLPGARGCQRLHPFASSSETPLVDCVSHTRLQFSALCLNLTVCFSSHGLLLVTHLFSLSALIVLSCLLITMWQLFKAHGVTRNEPKIHGICYITHGTHVYFLTFLLILLIIFLLILLIIFLFILLGIWSMTIYFYLIHYTLKLARLFEGAISFISTIELVCWFLMILLLIKFATLAIVLKLNLAVFLLNILYKLFDRGNFFFNNVKNSFPILLATAILYDGVNHEIFLVL